MDEDGSNVQIFPLAEFLEWRFLPCLFCRCTGHLSTDCCTWERYWPEGTVADRIDRRVHRLVFGEPTGDYYIH
uniref:Uncharacterized protein n=1 Tax=Ditylenchus dipsaci TaxID=166011 RepID=A0A915ESW5_9BILA